jgi:transcriptional regulator with GAF, ATPase, and Fis domain
MQLVNGSVVRPTPDEQTPQFERLIAGVSSTLSSVQLEELPSAFVETLERLCGTLSIDQGILIEFNAEGIPESCHSRCRRGQSDFQGAINPGDWRWLLQRVRLDGLVSVSRFDELPMDALGERDFARRSGLSSLLAVAVSIGGDCIGALVLGSAQRVREWTPVVQDRARLIAEIIGGALMRSRHEAALRASLTENQRLNRCLAAENVALKEDIKTFHDFDEIVGESSVMRAALERLAQVAPLNCSVLLQGETGTGKELFARALHDRSRRRGRALVRVNCAALPPTLVESELFGHEKGAFTGAVSLRQGRFELADGGTIFLDEIGDLPLDMQGKLLRVLQEGEFERVGSSRTRRVDVRVIAATHRNLEQAVAEGSFRPDLFYRLSVFPIQVPPLRDRREDIPSLTWYFIHHHQRALGRRIAHVPTPIIAALQEHDWPGNVRELENVVERALIRSHNGTLQLDDTFSMRVRQQAPAARGTLDEVQRFYIESTLQQCNWRINGVGNAAERLGIHPNTLRFRMKKLGIVSARMQRAAAES